MKYKAVILHAAAVFSALLLLLLLPSCRGEDAAPGEPRLTVGGKKADELTFAADLDAQTLQAHAGHSVAIFELAPGETSISGKSPVVQSKVSAKLRFRFPLINGETGGTRLYSSFLAVFSDGTYLSQTPCSLSNAGDLASDRSAFPHANGIKGLNASGSGEGFNAAELARSLYATHALTELKASELTAGDGESFTLNQQTLPVNRVLLEATDAVVRDASAAGMQVSLCLIPDAELPLASYAVLLDGLAARYSGGEAGTVTAILIGEAAPRTSQNQDSLLQDARRGAELLRIADLALTSRVANGRVYLAASGTVSGVRDYLLTASRSLSSGVSFGAAFAPDPTTAAQSGGQMDGNDRYFNLSNLSAMAQELSAEIGRNARFCVIGLEFSASDPSLQAALYTYAYRAAVNAKADFMIYCTQIGDETGLFASDLTARPAARAFRDADTDSNAEGESLAASLLGEDWLALRQVRPNRLCISEPANPGTSGGPDKRLFDFSSDKHPAFALAGTGSQPVKIQSASANGPVLCASLSPDETGLGSGYRCVLSAKQLDEIYVLSANLLPQTAASGPVSVTLLIDGTAADGRELSYSSTASVESNQWQTVSFHIRNFTSQAAPDADCSVTLLMNPSESSGSFALWLHSMHVRKAATDFSILLPVALVLAGFGVGVLAVVLLAKHSQKKKRRRF